MYSLAGAMRCGGAAAARCSRPNADATAALPLCLQADEMLREGKQKYVNGDRMGALRLFEDSMKQVGGPAAQRQGASLLPAPLDSLGAG
jgi:hypothetical protein